MFSHATEYVKHRFVECNITETPYPHLQIDNILPADLYEAMMTNKIDERYLATLKELKRVGSAYPETRRVLSLKPDMPQLPDSYKVFWQELAVWFLTDFKNIVLGKFDAHIRSRFGTIPMLYPEALYTYDSTTYALGPHTDSTKKVITLLLYLPKDDTLSHLGTSMYEPIDSKFVCEGGPHHKFDKFRLVKTAPFKPNTLFGFFKTNNSFHGVEPIKESIRRDLLIYDIQTVKT
jgi:hypothetical protein